MTDKEQAQIKELQARCQQYMSEIGRLEFKNAIAQQQINRLNAERLTGGSLRKQIVALYLELDKRIIQGIDRRSYVIPAQKNRKVFDLGDIENLSTAELLGMAKKYDVNVFFQLHSPRKNTKLRYRIAGHSYTTSRDIGKNVLKRGYKLARKYKVKSRAK